MLCPQLLSWLHQMPDDQSTDFLVFERTFLMRVEFLDTKSGRISRGASSMHAPLVSRQIVAQVPTHLPCGRPETKKSSTTY